MDRRVYINLLHKILYCIKFRNEMDFEGYQEIIFSPLYVELFKDIRKELFDSHTNKSLEQEMSGELTSRPEEYERVMTIIKKSDLPANLSVETKKELIDIVIYPYSINKADEDFLLSLFPHNSASI